MLSTSRGISKAIIFFPLAILCLGLSAITASASPVLIDGIYYELDNGRAVVTINGDPYSSYPY